MYYSVYILYSANLNKYYTGLAENVIERLQKHNNQFYDGNNFTKQTCDWTLYFEIPKLPYKEASAIEKHIKRMKSKIYIENLKKHPEIIIKLKTKYLTS